MGTWWNENLQGGFKLWVHFYDVCTVGEMRLFDLSAWRQKGVTGCCFKYIDRPCCLWTDVCSCTNEGKGCEYMYQTLNYVPLPFSICMSCSQVVDLASQLDEECMHACGYMYQTLNYVPLPFSIYMSCSQMVDLASQLDEECMHACEYMY